MRQKEKLYIIPTEYGLMYSFGIFVSLIGGAIYNNNLAFMLCFFLVALFLIGMVQTHNNLKKISLEKINLFLSPSDSQGHGVIWLKSENPEGHSQVRVQVRGGDDKIDFTIPLIYEKSLHSQYFDFESGQWGKKKLKRIRLSTRYPFGFFYVWRNLDCPVEYKIYPKPEGLQSLNSFHRDAASEGVHQLRAGDDFSEHRLYQYGDSQKHIDWKAYARGCPLLTKTFDDGQRQSYLIDFSLAQGDYEEKMHQMAAWVQEFEEKGCAYAVRLPGGVQSLFSSGEKHRLHCLDLLAGQRELS